MQIGDVYHILYECQVTAQGECELVCKLEMFTISYMSIKLLLKANVSWYQIGDVYHILYECQVTAQGECELVCKLETFTISYMSVKLLLKANVSWYANWRCLPYLM